MPAVTLDENVPASVGTMLRQAGHDVARAREQQLVGVSDDRLLTVAASEGRVLISFDRGFTNVIQHPPKTTPGIIVIRLRDQAPPPHSSRRHHRCFRMSEGCFIQRRSIARDVISRNNNFIAMRCAGVAFLDLDRRSARLAPLAGYLFDRRARSFSFSLQTVSSTSLSGSSTSVAFTVNGFVYMMGSSIVMVRSMWPTSRR